MLMIFVAFAALGAAHPIKTTADKIGENRNPCDGSIMATIRQLKPIAIQMAQLARSNTVNGPMYTEFFGKCPVELVNSVYDQIIQFPPDDDNFQCPPPSDTVCADGQCGAYTSVDLTGSNFTAICPGSLDPKYAILNDCGAATMGQSGLLLHEMAHHMDVTPGWGVRDGPNAAGKCYGRDCITATARDYPDCQNAHIADAYLQFAIATNCSSPTPVLPPPPSP